MAITRRNLQDELNRMNPTAGHVGLGDVIADLIAKHNALLAKVDTDATAQNAAVTSSQLDVDYEATLAVTSLDQR